MRLRVVRGTAASLPLTERARQLFFPGLRFAVSLGLVVTIALVGHFDTLYERVRNANLVLVAGGVALLLLQFPLAAWRWNEVLSSLSGPSEGRLLLRLVWLGQFINQLLPTFLAGDAVRLWYLRRSGIQAQLAFSSLFWDRLLGCAGLALLAIVGIPRLLQVADIRTSIVLLSLWLLIAVGTATALWASSFTPLVSRIPARTSLMPILEDGRTLRRRPGTLANILAAAAFTNVLASCSAYMLARAIHIDLSFVDTIALVPLALFVSLLPISIAGWGVREATLAYLLPLVGVARPDAVTISVLLGGAFTISALPGVLLWLQAPEREVAPAIALREESTA